MDFEHDALGRIHSMIYPYLQEDSQADKKFKILYTYQNYSGLLDSIKGGKIDQNNGWIDSAGNDL